MTDHRDFYRGRRVLVTGALGFIGSNLCRTLADLGASVLAVDSLLPDYGGNLFNIDGIADRVQVNIADVRQQSTMNYLVRNRDVIFNLAGQVSHIDSMRDPSADLEINCRSQLTILEACRYNNPGVKVVYAGTRQVYGRPDSLPVDNAYARRLKLYRGEMGPDAVITPADTADVQAATLAYGLGNWYLVRGDTAKAKSYFERSVKSGGWPGFGFIVSEVELRRLK